MFANAHDLPLCLQVECPSTSEIIKKTLDHDHEHFQGTQRCRKAGRRRTFDLYHSAKELTLQ
jgi:hypothetical protein